MNKSLIIQALAASKIAAEKAGAIVRSIYRNGSLNVVEKGVDDPQTECDRQSQFFILDHLKRLLPQVRIVAEEPTSADDTKYSHDFREIEINDYDLSILQITCPDEFANASPEEVTIWVDPVDGTSSLAKGQLHSVTILIGIAFRQLPVAGVIHCPFSKNENDLIFSDTYASNWSKDNEGHTMYGLLNHGLYGIMVRDPPGQDILTTSKAHLKKIETTQKAMQIIYGSRPKQILYLNGCGFKILSTLTGVTDLYVYPTAGLKKWDTCAPEVFLRIAGGELTDCNGDRIDYWCRGDCNANDEQKSYGLELGILASLKEHSKYFDLIIRTQKGEI
ncbi:hypothetical protein ACOME3_006884 [Neoechinorhynchus agilis]